MKKILLPALLISMLTLQSCFKDDDRVTPHDSGDLQVDTIGMAQDYRNQVYFDLSDAHVAATNLKSSWDIGFDCTADGYHIILNTSNFMKVSDAGVLPFPAVLDTAGRKWYFDKSDGNPDSNAIGKWFNIQGDDTLSNQHVYILDRGMDEQGEPLGFRQIIFDSLKNNVYYFRVAFLDGGNPTSYSVPKDPDRNHVFFSFKFGGVIQNFEPPKNEYDLLFTQYTTTLFTNAGDPYPYLVTGVLLNRNGVMAIRDTLHTFETVTLDQAMTLTLSPALDIIGYDWKYYNFDAGSYTVYSDMLYIVKDTDGYYYKLRFIGFYNALGEKGYPVMEFQKL
ncbi:MAG: HmuY family protein [Bacteroidales bacterium]